MRISLNSIAKRYGETCVFDNFCMTIGAGDIHAILGPNGSGKSTLLRLAALLEPPDSGQIAYLENGASVKQNLSLRRRIAVVLPGDSLFNDSVFNNVAYGLRVRGTPKAEIAQRTDRAIEAVKLAGKTHRHVRSLSLGEAQRVALARALVLEPEVLFLDEPTASLDPSNTEIIEQALLNSKARRQTTIILITHNLFQAKRIAQRVTLLHCGRVIEEAAAEEFFGNPQQEITRTFLSGKMVC